jgi:hypothetical protein
VRGRIVRGHQTPVLEVLKDAYELATDQQPTLRLLRSYNCRLANCGVVVVATFSTFLRVRVWVTSDPLSFHLHRHSKRF